jgi:hypothetical protein
MVLLRRNLPAQQSRNDERLQSTTSAQPNADFLGATTHHEQK